MLTQAVLRSFLFRRLVFAPQARTALSGISVFLRGLSNRGRLDNAVSGFILPDTAVKGVNEKCRSLAKKIKEIIDTKSSFADWLNNQIVRDQLKFDIRVCLIKNGYPPQYSPEVFSKVMEQVENFEENQ